MQGDQHFGVGYIVNLAEASPLTPDNVTGQLIWDGHGNRDLLDRGGW